MTLVITTAYADRIEFLTDRATVDENGVVLDLSSKVRVHSSGMAVAYRGRVGISDAINAALEEAVERHGFDAGLALLGDLLAEQRHVLADGGIDFDILIAGTSELHGFGLWVLPSHNGISGMPAFQATKAPVGFCLTLGGVVDMAALALAGIFRPMLEASLARGAFLAEFGTDIAEPMRKASPTRSIGGGLDLTTVFPSGAVTIPLRRWSEDVVGQKINPDAPLPNRKARRAMRGAA